MLNKIKTYLTLISIIIAILASGYGLYSKVRADRMQAERDNAMDELLVKTTQVTKYKNELGQEVTKTIEYEREISDLENSTDSLERVLYKTIKASKLREKDIEEAYVIRLRNETSGGYDSIVRTTDTIHKIQTIPCDDIRYFNNGFYEVVSYPDSITIVNNESISLIKAKRRVPRKIQPFKWIGWEWKKTIDKSMMEVVSNNPNSDLNGRMIKIK